MRVRAILTVLLLLLVGTSAWASTITTTGYLDPNALDPSLPAWAQRVAFDLGVPQPFPSEHTNVVLVDFVVSTDGTLDIDSYGYAGTGSGIDPYVTLFSGSTGAPTTTTFALEYSPGGDFFFTTPSLTAGNYVLAISAWDNYACPFGLIGCSLADGFSGLANLPPGHDTFFDIRITGDVVPGMPGPGPTPVPEPSMLLPFAGGAILLIRRARGALRAGRSNA